MLVTTAFGQYRIEELPSREFRIEKVAWWGRPPGVYPLPSGSYHRVNPVGHVLVVQVFSVKVGVPFVVLENWRTGQGLGTVKSRAVLENVADPEARGNVVTKVEP